MKKKLSLSILLWTLFFLTGNINAQTAVQPAGSGTLEDPYKVETLDNLYWITQNNSSWDKHFKQTDNIDAAATSGWDGGAGFLPIGNTTTPFTGSYNGQGGAVIDLTINRPSTNFIGMFGFVEGGEIENLGIYADMTGSWYAGAIAGYVSCSSTISNCLTDGTLTGDYYTGGVVGSLEDGSTLDNCGCLVNVEGERYVGGLVGRNLATITDCYASGSVNGTVSDEGGLVGGTANPTVSNSFWDTQTSTLAVSAGGTGKTTSEMKTLATYTSAATGGLTTPWDFVGTPNDDTGIEDWWNMDPANTYSDGYPIPSWFVFTNMPSGDGSSGTPYQITTLNHLYWLTQTSAAWATGVYVEQTADIAAHSTAYINFGQGFLPIATGSIFDASYNGQEHEIAGLFINRNATYNIGLFSEVSGTVSDLHLVDVEISGKENVAGLVGKIFSGTLLRCSCTGNVGIPAVSNYVGLLVGVGKRTALSADIYIDQCWTAGTVTGNIAVGGLIGALDDSGSGLNAEVTDCYSRADVTATNNLIGGLIGFLTENQSGNAISIENCYSTGMVVCGGPDVGGFVGIGNANDYNTYTANFWDTETSGTTDGDGHEDPDPPGIEGKTTAEMKTESTFINAGWDFVNIWDMDVTQNFNSGYPYFQWMNTTKALDIKAFLEGPFNGTDMNTDIYGVLPLSQPYNTAPWNYTGTESVTAISNTDVVDWILIELRDAPDAASAGSAAVVARQAAFLLKDGSVVGTDGSSFPTFTGLTIQQSLFVVVRHRNHIAIMSATPLYESGGVYSYDFTTGAGQVYGGTLAHKEIAPGIWGLTAADGNADNQVNNGDKNDVWAPQAGTGGYSEGDFNLDAQVNNGDKNDVWVPNTGLGGQVPE